MKKAIAFLKSSIHLSGVVLLAIVAGMFTVLYYTYLLVTMILEMIALAEGGERE